MKPMYECLDITLRQLVKDWDNYGDERVQLRCEELLRSFELSDRWRKHEFFKRLIKKLVTDGYAQHKDNREYNYDDLDDFQKNTIITIEGYYFITEENGYTQIKINQTSENNRVATLESNQRANANRMTYLTIVLAVSALGTLVYYGVDLRWNHGWFASGFWWTLVLVVAAVCSVTTYLIVKMLLRKKQQPQQQK